MAYIADTCLLDRRHFVSRIRYYFSGATHFCLYRIELPAALASLKSRFIVEPGECACRNDDGFCG